MGKPLPLAAQSYKHDALQFSSQRLINQFLETAPPSGETRSKYIIRGTPGSTAFVNIDSGPIRAMKPIGDRLFVISNNNLYTVNSVGVATNRGTLMISQPYIDIIQNNTQALIAAGTTGYYYTLASDTLTQISDGDFPGASSALFIDGYGLIVKPVSAQSNLSALNDFSSWDALAFTTEATVQQNILSVRDDRKEFWMFGQKAIVPYFRTGSGVYPFARVTQAVMDMGCVAQWSVAASDNSYFWLGQRTQEGGYAVWRATGYTPQRISTHAIEGQIESFPQAIIAGAIAFTYMMNGHLIYVLNFLDYGTFCCDSATGLWHEWLRYGQAWSTYTHHAVFNGQHIVGGADGKLYTLSPSVYVDGAFPIQRRMVTPVYDVGGGPLRISRVELEMEAGVGLTLGQGADPQVMLRVSKDGGMTYGNEYWRTLGRVGTYNTRAIWRNLGRAHDWCLDIQMTDPVQYAVFGANAYSHAGR